MLDKVIKSYIIGSGGERIKMKVFIKNQEFDEFIVRKNLSLSDFARMIGITPGHLSRLKDSNKYRLSPSAKIRERMLKVIDCNFDDIFFTCSA